MNSELLVTWPTGLTAVLGQTLEAISLASYTNNPAGTFTWTGPLSTSAGAVGVQSYNMTFTPTDATNYNTLMQDVSITVVNRTIYLDTSRYTTWTTASAVTYAYFWQSEGNPSWWWVRAVHAGNNLFSMKVPEDATWVIFTRIDPSKESPDGNYWGAAVWSQTADIQIPTDKDTFFLYESGIDGVWE